MALDFLCLEGGWAWRRPLKKQSAVGSAGQRSELKSGAFVEAVEAVKAVLIGSILVGVVAGC